MSRRAIAIHEAAHTVVAYRTDGWIPPGSKVFASATSGRTEASFLSADGEAIATLAAPLATKLLLGVEDGAASDYQEVMALANANGGEATFKRWLAHAMRFLKEGSTAAAIGVVADQLEKRGELSGVEVEELLQPFLRKWFPAPKDTRKFPTIVRHKITAGGSSSSARGRFESPTHVKGFDVIKRGDMIVDYQNVTIEGYLSTFKNVTESDRQGDYVERGAFTETIKRFMRNPVLLADHTNRVENMAGSFVELREDDHGLWFRAVLSNSDTDRMRGLRALVAEGHLKTTSMGGIFHYRSDGRGIVKVDLLEGSLTPIPANPDAIFQVAV